MQEFKCWGAITKYGVKLATTKNGKFIANFTICVKSGSGQYEETEYFQCEVWGNKAKAIEKYFQPHSLIYIKNGEWHNKPWKKDAEGKDIPCWKLKVIDFEFMPINEKKSADEASYATDEPDVSYGDNDTSASYGGGSDDFQLIDDSADLPF